MPYRVEGLLPLKKSDRAKLVVGKSIDPIKTEIFALRILANKHPITGKKLDKDSIWHSNEITDAIGELFVQEHSEIRADSDEEIDLPF